MHSHHQHQHCHVHQQQQCSIIIRTAVVIASSGQKNKNNRKMLIKSLLLLSTLQGYAVQADDLDLLVVHANDMHARYEQTDVHGTPCNDEQAESEQCYGGFPRLKTAVDHARHQATDDGIPFLHLNAGDTFQGTLYYNMFRWKLAARMIDRLGIDVMSLGNHEFDDGVDDLRSFLTNISVPVVCTNLNLTLEPRLQNVDSLTTSKIVKIRDKLVGFVGYLTPETNDLAATENVILLDEVSALRREVGILKSKNVNIIIALGHSGFRKDVEIAEKVPGISLIIGGHSHTFMYNAKEEPPSIEKPKTDYPYIAITKTGRRVPILQAYCKTKYLGKFKATFNDDGHVVSISGKPILLDSTVRQDEALLKDITKSKKKMNHISSKKIGMTKVFLSMEPTGDIFESNLANLILDSYVDYAALNTPVNSSFWTDAPLSFMQGGIMKSSLDHKKNQGVITYGDLLTVLPFDNRLVKVKLAGTVIKEALEYSVRRLSYIDRLPFFQEFLHFSGLKVVYDLNQPSGERVKYVSVVCGNCSIPMHESLQSDRIYTVVTTYYTASGGDGYYMLKHRNMGIEFMGPTDLQVVSDYIKRQGVVHPSIENRIVMLFPNRQPNEANSSSAATKSNYTMTGICALSSIFWLTLVKSISRWWI